MVWAHVWVTGLTVLTGESEDVEMRMRGKLNDKSRRVDATAKSTFCDMPPPKVVVSNAVNHANHKRAKKINSTSLEVLPSFHTSRL